jgi:hypothetical protein
MVFAKISSKRNFLQLDEISLFRKCIFVVNQGRIFVSGLYCNMHHVICEKKGYCRIRMNLTVTNTRPQMLYNLLLFIQKENKVSASKRHNHVVTKDESLSGHCPSKDCTCKL